MNILTEGSQARDHPFGSGLSIHGDGRARCLAQRSEAPAKVVSPFCHLFVRDPVVIAEGKFLEELSVLLHFIFFAEDLSGAKAALPSVLLHCVVERLGDGVHLSVDDDLLVDRALAFFAPV